MKFPRGRIRTLVGGIASVVIVAGIFTFGQGKNSETELSWPTTADAGQQGLQGVYRWLTASDIPSFSWRRPYDEITTHSSASHITDSSLLIASWPQKVPATQAEKDALADWISEGNTLLALTVSRDTPLWARVTNTSHDDEWFESFGLYADATDVDVSVWQPSDASVADLRSFQRHELSLTPLIKQGLFAGVDSLTTRYYESEPRKLTYSAGDGSDALWPILGVANENTVALELYRYGKGRILISHYPELISNAVLDKSDNPVFLGNLVSQSVGPRGAVFFDDFHFGLSDLYDGDAFYRDPRLHRTLIALGILWLLWLVGRSTRLAPLRESKHRPSARALVEATSGLYARKLSDLDAGTAMLEHFERDVRRTFRISAHSNVWESAGKRLGPDHAALNQLQIMSNKLTEGRKQPLVKLSEAIFIVRQDLYRK